jgi:hypothetical protein
MGLVLAVEKGCEGRSPHERVRAVTSPLMAVVGAVLRGRVLLEKLTVSQPVKQFSDIVPVGCDAMQTRM